MELITKNNYDAKHGDVYRQYYHEVHARRDLTPLDKIIYTVVRNKFNLSIGNDKYMNKDGEYFVYYSQKEIAEDSYCSEKAVGNAFKRFQCLGKDGNPIEGLRPLVKLDDSETNTYRIYFYELTGEYGKYERKNGAVEVKKDKPANTPPKQEKPVVEPPVEPVIPVSVPVDNPVDNAGIVCGQDVDNVSPISGQATPFDVYLAQAENEVEREQEQFSYAHEKFSEVEEKFSVRNKEPLERLNKEKEIKKSNNKSIYLSSNTPKVNKMDDELKFRQTLSRFREQIDYSYLIQEIADVELLDDFCLSAVDMLMSSETRVNKESKPLPIIQSVLSRLTSFHMQQVLDDFSKLTIKIDNITGYMKTMLYNIAINSKAKLDQQVRHDMYGVA